MAAGHPLAGRRLDTVTLLVSEVVTNAVTHARVPRGTEIELTVAITPELTRVMISDGGGGFERAGSERIRRERIGGYGLMLLDAEASRWGTRLAPDRFSVWFEVDHVTRATSAVTSSSSS